MKTSPNTILITGTTSGVGLALLNQLYLEGNRIIGVNRRNASELENRYPKAKFMIADIANADAVLDLMQRLRSDAWEPDTLILNAGINKVDNSTKIDLPVFQEVLETNLIGNLTFVGALQKMKVSGKTIVTISSTSALVPNSANLGYYLSKKSMSEVFRLLRYSDPTNTYKVVMLGPTKTALNRTLPAMSGFQKTIFDFLTLEPEWLAKKVASFIRDRRQVLHPSVVTRLFYFSLHSLLMVFPGIYYKPYGRQPHG